MFNKFLKISLIVIFLIGESAFASSPSSDNTQGTLYPVDVKTLERIANSGDEFAQMVLGCAYLSGYKVKQDYQKAYKLFALVKDEDGTGYPELFMGYMHYSGLGVEHSNKLAKKFYQIAADKGCLEAIYQLALIKIYALSDSLGDKSISQEESLKEYKEAIRLFKLAADKGHPHAQIKVATMYLNGQIDRDNYVEAKKYINLAISDGCIEGHTALGALYHIKGDYRESIKNLKTAVDHGSALATILLAEHYAAGEGVIRDMTQARKYVELGIQRGLSDKYFKWLEQFNDAQYVMERSTSNSSGIFNYSMLDMVNDFLGKNSTDIILSAMYLVLDENVK